MDIHDLTRRLKEKSHSKIIFLVADGLGGLPMEPGGKTELETAHHPNLDDLAAKGILGLVHPVLPGITPGSGPGHLGIFGYDPLKYEIGRGALEATGVGFPLAENDVAARGNFCTLDGDGNITDRRAGRISTEESGPLARRLNGIKIPGVEIFVEPVKEHRFVLVMRADGLGGNVLDTDPQETGVPPIAPKATNAESQRTAEAASVFIEQAREILKHERKANGLTLRGFAPKPKLPSYEEVYGLQAAAIAVYPMYKGLAHLVGMTVLGSPQNLSEEVTLLRESWEKYDYFFLHFKYTDSTGEDGNFEAKVKRIEELDAVIPRITALEPSVLVVTADHSTPSKLKSHSWHPVPVLLSSDTCRPDPCRTFTESSAIMGGLGHLEAKYLMVLALAHAGRLAKYGA